VTDLTDAEYIARSLQLLDKISADLDRINEVLGQSK
jgi:hypothetical protein